MRHGRRRPLTADQIDRTGAFIAEQQESDGGLPWCKGGKMDPWDHVQASMGLALTGQIDRARRRSATWFAPRKRTAPGRRGGRTAW